MREYRVEVTNYGTIGSYGPNILEAIRINTLWEQYGHASRIVQSVFLGDGLGWSERTLGSSEVESLERSHINASLGFGTVDDDEAENEFRFILTGRIIA